MKHHFGMNHHVDKNKNASISKIFFQEGNPHHPLQQLGWSHLRLEVAEHEASSWQHGKDWEGMGRLMLEWWIPIVIMVLNIDCHSNVQWILSWLSIPMVICMEYCSCWSSCYSHGTRLQNQILVPPILVSAAVPSIVGHGRIGIYICIYIYIIYIYIPS